MLVGARWTAQRMRLVSGTMTELRLAEAARLLGVSDDTVRRWVESGRLTSGTDVAGRKIIDGAELATFASSIADAPPPGPTGAASARNRMVGIVTRVVRDTVMAQVEMQCGPHRIVSLMSREAADELALQPGVVAVASIKSTNVVVEIEAT
jgi:molybdopterin-binding protein